MKTVDAGILSAKPAGKTSTPDPLSDTERGSRCRSRTVFLRRIHRTAAFPGRDHVAGSSAIAGRLYLSESTAKSHIGRIYDKLGAANRAQALVTAMRMGLISSATPPA